MKNDNRQEVDRPDFNRWEAYMDGEWDKLNETEKTYMRAYRNHLSKETNPFNLSDLILKVNDIHEKYPDFHIGMIL